jgi:hypothetical protein
VLVRLGVVDGLDDTDALAVLEAGGDTVKGARDDDTDAAKHGALAPPTEKGEGATNTQSTILSIYRADAT